MRGAQHRNVRLLGCSLAGLVLATAGTMVRADTGSTSPAVETLKQRVDEQRQQIELLRQELMRQDAELLELRRAVDTSRLRARGVESPPAARGQPPQQVAQTQQPVGQAPERAEESRPPEIAPIFEQPGVLTPRDQWVLEPSLQYAYSSSNRISLVGYTIIPALLIGLVDVREVKSHSFIGALTVRRGMTNRFELEAKFPYVYRTDTTVGREILQDSATERLFESSGHGIGDVEITGRYQLNDGGLDKPYYIASLRLKTRTGKDPFEVRTTIVPGFRGGGLEREKPTGSGFYTLTPGLTVLIPSDPVVLFGGVSYQHSFKRSGVKRRTDDGWERIGTVQPGPTFGFNFGMGLALNERSSFSIGYDHLSVGKVKVNGKTAPTSVRVQLGTLLLGYSYRLDSGRTLNLSVGAGLTRDTPDLTLTLRVPISL